MLPLIIGLGVAGGVFDFIGGLFDAADARARANYANQMAQINAETVETVGQETSLMNQQLAKGNKEALEENARSVYALAEINRNNKLQAIDFAEMMEQKSFDIKRKNIEMTSRVEQGKLLTSLANTGLGIGTGTLGDIEVARLGEVREELAMKQELLKIDLAGRRFEIENDISMKYVEALSQSSSIKNQARLAEAEGVAAVAQGKMSKAKAAQIRAQGKADQAAGYNQANSLEWAAGLGLFKDLAKTTTTALTTDTKTPKK